MKLENIAPKTLHINTNSNASEYTPLNLLEQSRDLQTVAKFLPLGLHRQ